MAEGNTKANELDPTLDFVAGTLGGMASLFVGHPLDTIKVRMQSPDIASKYHGTLHAFRTILKEERLRGLYKGVTSPLAGVAFLNGLVFASYGVFIRAQLPHAMDEPTLSQVCLAGAGSGIVASIVTTPTELVKIRQQTMLSRSGLPSTYKVATTIIRTEGLRGLYRGISATCMRDLAYGGYFATYEGICRLFRKSNQSSTAITYDHASLINEMESFEHDLSWTQLMVAGGFAGIMGWITTFPMDAVKSRIQATYWVSPTSPGFKASDHPYNNVRSALVNSYRTLGVRGLFAGLTPTLIRAVPVNMVTFLVYEWVVAAVNGTRR